MIRIPLEVVAGLLGLAIILALSGCSADWYVGYTIPLDWRPAPVMPR